MEKFGHFFEFFAALNSAYIVSTHFLESLIGRINSKFISIIQDLDLVKTIQDKNSDRLISEGAKCAGQGNADEVIKKLHVENESIQDDIANLNNEIKSTISTNAVLDNFNYLCLFGALYCIFLLVLNGFEFQFHEQINREMFGLFNILSIIMLMWILFGWTFKIFKKVQPSYSSVIYVFCLALILSFPIFLFVQYLAPSLNCDYDFMWFNMISSVLLPTSHFLYYAIRMGSRTKTQSATLKTKAYSLKGKCETFANTLNIAFETINTMVKEEKK